ncbi:hypothetical protein LNV08_11855 [Paucibacter sp. TC2R-5]|uniref:hypothetical protein n=1 Tax=Paucibacter sp. TC2R-5 TaxID=2893555 RepID=UPI0021E459E7|nr:hypothetical protein [Paucibacter sp. TC2R-5]MCV2359664.1 hypothetical protein [Paucibacter sp. TC2R-5]
MNSSANSQHPSLGTQELDAGATDRYLDLVADAETLTFEVAFRQLLGLALISQAVDKYGPRQIPDWVYFYLSEIISNVVSTTLAGLDAQLTPYHQLTGFARVEPAQPQAGAL